MKKIIAIFLVLLVGCFKPTTDEVLSRIGERIKNIESFKAKMVTSMEMLGQMVDIEADVWFKIPYKMRTEANMSTLPGKQIMTFDGKIIWMYYEGLKQATKIDVTGLDEQIKDKLIGQSNQIIDPFKNFDKKVIKYIKNEKVDGEETYLLDVSIQEMMPGSPIKLSKISFWISANDGLVRKMVFYGEKDSIAMSIICKNVEINPWIDDGLFSFVPSPSTKVMDMSQMMDQMMQSLPR
ncbi:TPA: hypothetical protein DCX16_05205 [bacterium]|nr:hypothetical protein [bacterium]